MKKKKDWVKIIAIVLAILFFIAWRTAIYYSDNYFDNCEQTKKDLHYQWQQAYTDLQNCYENGLSSCNTLLPTLEKLS